MQDNWIDIKNPECIVLTVRVFGRRWKSVAN